VSGLACEKEDQTYTTSDRESFLNSKKENSLSPNCDSKLAGQTKTFEIITDLSNMISWHKNGSTLDIENVYREEQFKGTAKRGRHIPVPYYGELAQTFMSQIKERRV
jgi:hypothetical protein